MEFNELKELIKLFSESNIGKLEISNEGLDLKLSKPKERISVAAAMEPIAMAPMAAPVAAPAAIAAAPAAEENDNYTYVTSPIVGTFYRAPNPKADPFVEVGDTVKKGQTLCIVEAMKLMNEIQSDVNGVVKKILMENGEGVEYGQNLIAIEPA